jgi:pyruvate,water dikinase
MWSIFYGRPSANVDCWRDLYERGLTESGTGGEAQRQVFGSASAEAGTVPAPDRRAEVSAKRPAALANATSGLRSVRKEIGEWWKRATSQAALSDRSQSEDYFSQAVAWFERADPYHIMVSLFATEAVTEIATAAERAGLPEAANALMVGYPGMEEFQTTVALWDLSRGRLTHAAFLESHGYHGAHEGEIASESWRENSQSIDALATRYRLLKASDDPRQLEVRALETRQRIQSELRSALPAAERSGLDDALERAATFLPLREAGRASLTIALDAMRAHARVLAQGLVEIGALESSSDVFLLTRFELLDLPGNARELVSARRALRENYSGFDLPETWQGMPQKQTLGSQADGSVNPNSERLSVGTQLNGLGASAGIHEGTARVVLDALELGNDFDPGDVLIAPATDPSWAPFFLIAGAVVIDTGSNISHAAVVAREMGIPAVVSVPDASLTLRTGQRVRVDGNAGSVEVVG